MSASADLARARLKIRAARAARLADVHHASAELLTFYSALASFQAALLSDAAHVLRRGSAGAFAEALDAHRARLLPPRLVGWLTAQHPARVEAAASTLAHTSEARWRNTLDTCWRGGGARVDGIHEIEQFVAEAVLQPFAESLALALPAGAPMTPSAEGEPPAAQAATASTRGAGCVLCAGPPVVATLHEQGHGSRRSLVCGLCSTEWPTARLVCVACGESGADALLVYRAEEFPGARIDACDTCRAYIKTIDRTVDGTADPLVDDLASLPLDLWAAEQGYRKIRPNVLRL